jgi:antitoxin ParD1/3/4
MPTRNVNLTKELDRFVAKSVKSGHYANASEVMRSALRLLVREEREDEEKLKALRKAIAEGDASGYLDGDEFFKELDVFIQELAKEKSENVA